MVKQFYELQVYDEFVVLGNTAVLRCHVPSFVRDYVVVTSWVRGARERVTADVATGEISRCAAIMLETFRNFPPQVEMIWP